MMRSVLFPAMMLLGLLGSVQATEYIKHSLCNVESSNQYCGVRYTTASSSYVSSVPADECLYCNPGYEESDCSLSSSPYKAFEDGGTTAGSSCSWNGCGWGGCPDGTTETDSIGCALSNNEKCCTNVNTWKCCHRKSCPEAPLCNSDCNNMCADQGYGSINHVQANGICYCSGMPNDGGIKAVCNEPESSPPPPLPPTSPPPPPLLSPPPFPPPQTEAESADTTQNCKCSCCTGNYCSASIVASYDAESSSNCGAADCRSRFSTLCPASGDSGSVSASYSESTTSSSSSTSTLTSDATSLKICASSLAAVGISLMLAY